MVLYEEDGRVVIVHEKYLEEEAEKERGSVREKYPYTDPINVCKQRNGPKSTEDVKIIIESQIFKTLYCEKMFGWGSDFEYIKSFRQREDKILSGSLCRETLILCSSFAKDHFTYNPDSNELRLPVSYPQAKGVNQPDDQLAYIRADEIEAYIFPWLDKVKAYMNSPRSNQTTSQKMKDYLTNPNGPIAMRIPSSLLEKIHLYNCMLQLGLPKFIQSPLIDALIHQLYKTKLSACHLDTIEITICRFYSRGIAILDPVINHLIGTYSLRSLPDRNHPKPAGKRKHKYKDYLPPQTKELAADDVVRLDGTLEIKFENEIVRAVDFSETNRRYLKFTRYEVSRGKLGKDSCLLPPVLPVLGHCIRHWSGVRKNGGTAAAYTGLPLNVGWGKKFAGRGDGVLAEEGDYEVEGGNRLVGWGYFRANGPGLGEEREKEGGPDEDMFSDAE
ncbi:hypothetical protein COCMIDRAFT_106413 [Bipolaris oryzae ATCC 44560]|uniref:Uncharacterized protein n=1 Tax=Bipolaris oryzae ATCC 44560 TaxID=930090 RepID=W6YUX0_COCMI|nr:uncharacterized protein COCMIDRAFT_106413 [Bipolaris oryzae ATCC 44560]EUC41345.1 hypothetical protein COCMIDRAFT_106413 [Bipolaris oryzae ATCC 44560]